MRPAQWPPTFVVDGKLPSMPSSAKAYRLAAGDTTAIAKVARAFGLSGGVTSVTDPTNFTEWVVRSGTKELHVSGGNAFSWYLFDSSNSASTLPIVPPTRPADLPTSDEAKKIAFALASNLGIDATNAAVRVDDSVTEWSVSIEPRIDGMSTQGYGLYLGVGSKGKLVDGNGFLGALTVDDSYPIVTPEEGLTRLADQNYLMDGGGGSSGSGPPNSRVPWVVHITGARLVLTPRRISESEMLLVPSYEYTATDGSGTWLAIAVGADFLTQAPATVMP